MSEFSSGFDIFANNDDMISIAPMNTAIIPTGLTMEIPAGYEVQIRPRSGLAIKKNITVLNTPGTIDADYRGEVKIILTNFGKEPFEIHNGDRIAQMVINKLPQCYLSEVDELNSTQRGAGGFGSTGQ